MAPKSKATKQGDAASLIYPPFLYLGPRTSSSAAFITAHGITHVLSIGSTPTAKVASVSYHRLPLTDSPTASIDKIIGLASAVIDSARAGKILVHCSAAVSRSPTVVAAYLMTRCGLSLKDALGLIVKARPAVCPNEGFLSQLKELEMELRGECSLDVDILPGKKEDRLALFNS
ncbi:phosphatases II [Laetiporus sulphureus 93-53]|uniref:protein-tyrosine-phosphatase n=1 Tax=Laetiporus sulphureus 93-53 TaxID=1314785 RepID=A0A165BTW9_9APHY|nr:phosphatases II [Laetiporus sulphureus 93-53]KZT01642.1 phosphatases II [Laetiporus sulphureus 93-53]